MADLVVAARLKEAREYLGFTREEVAHACGWDTERVAALEDGTAGTVTGEELRKLSRLYRRPVEWFRGESTWQPPEDLLRKTEHLTPGDREAILDFAEWLEGAGKPTKPQRKGGER